jgi:hypothetical protein
MLAAMLVMGATVVAIITGRPVIASRIGQLWPLFEEESPPSDGLLDAQAEVTRALTTSKTADNR